MTSWPETPAAANPGEACPTCQRRVPIPREDTTPRKRAQLNISVPADTEDGAEVLRTLIEAAREKLTSSGAFAYDAKTPPYFTLVAVLHDWLTA